MLQHAVALPWGSERITAKHGLHDVSAMRPLERLEALSHATLEIRIGLAHTTGPQGRQAPGNRAGLARNCNDRREARGATGVAPLGQRE